MAESLVIDMRYIESHLLCQGAVHAQPLLNFQNTGTVSVICPRLLRQADANSWTEKELLTTASPFLTKGSCGTLQLHKTALWGCVAPVG